MKDFVKYCRELKKWRWKGRAQKVVRKKCGRGGLNPTRLEGLVVWTVVSCLGMIVSEGMFDRGSGSWNC